MEKVFIFCNLIKKSKLSYILDSLHTNWNISSFFFIIMMVTTYSLGKLKIQYLKKFEYFLKDQSKKDLQNRNVQDLQSRV